MQHSILIVDDEQDIRDLIRIALLDEGFNVLTAANGTEALARIVREKPSLVILDLMMPEISGEDVCRVIKRDPALDQIIVVILSGKDDLTTKLNCLRMGAEEYLTKPIDMSELTMRITRFVKLLDRRADKEPQSVASVSETNGQHQGGQYTLPTVHRPLSDNTPVSEEKIERPVAKIVAATENRTRYGIYRLERLAGSGGMGLVYKAYDESLDRYVAVKVLSKEWSSSPEFVGRFRTEAKLIAAIDHPGIAQIYTFGEESGESYFVLQWCAGGSLADLIRKEGNLELLQAIDFCLQAAHGLSAAISKGVVHKDIKPSNLMFDENRRIKIVDFGVASREQVGENTQQSLSIIGSPAYMSPEQARGEMTDQRADIYSLGITFYYMIYSRLPFNGKDPLELVAQHLQQPFPAYDDLGGTIPISAYRIIETMTRKEKAARYPTYADLIRDLESLRNELYGQRRLKLPLISGTERRPSMTGDNLAHLLSNLLLKQESGIMSASWGTLKKQFLIKGDQIVLFESPQNDENVWNALVQKKLMERRFVPASGESLEASLNHLLFLQAVTPEQFSAEYGQVMQQSIVQVFQWPVFHGEFFSGAIENEPFARVSIPRLLLLAGSIIPFESIRRSVPDDKLIFRSAIFQDILPTLDLERKESFLVSRIEGNDVTVETLQVLTGFSAEKVYRIVYSLHLIGALEYVSKDKIRTRRDRETIAAPRPALNEKPNPADVIVEKRDASVPTDRKEQFKKTPWLDNRPPADAGEGAKYFKLAEEKFKAGSYWDAKRYCLQAIMNNPSEPRYHHLMARALMRYPHSAKAAEEEFRQAIALDPGNLQYRLDLAGFLKDKGQYLAARKECESILEIWFHDKRAIRLLKEIEYGL